MKKILVLGGLAAAVFSAAKRRKLDSKADSAKLWSEAVNQPKSS